MKITIHEAECNVGYARPIFRSMNRDEVVKEIADTCREDWDNNNWGDSDVPPPIPEWDTRPGHPVEDWQYEVAGGDTRQSYAEWCDRREGDQ
jgi:hypothetical protein